MSNLLTRDDILKMQDIETKEITVPAHIPAWGGKTLRIKQLTRGQQDAFLKRRFGDTRMQQDRKARNQEIKGVNLYGHDAWLFVRGVCDENGKAMFTDADIAALENHNGEAVGWVASEIVKFSGMAEDLSVERGEQSAEEVAGEEIKN